MTLARLLHYKTILNEAILSVVMRNAKMFGDENCERTGLRG